ncbi:hypothetical protein [Thiobacter aerophilum]|uniref:Uncharacterized protein n=1 Tax=Thiobacter aerophilum TaxID=3121275 RepID=A0ABV0EFI9_9BURK
MRSLLTVTLLTLCGWALAAQQVEIINPETGLKSWKKLDRGFSIELVQILPEFVEATYASRDLPRALYASMKGYCIFGTVVRNESDAPLSYRVAEWRYVTRDGKRHRLRTKSEWIAVWRKLGADFSYSILPDDIEFDVGDWAQGFTTPKIAPGTRFDLIYTWRQHGKILTGKLENLECPQGSGLR